MLYFFLRADDGIRDGHVTGVQACALPISSAQDVESAKPDPDLVHTALDAAGVPAERAVFVGDTVWDVEAAERAGVPAVGVLTGGISAAELTEAGAVEVYASVAEILEQLDATLLRRAWAS